MVSGAIRRFLHGFKAHITVDMVPCMSLSLVKMHSKFHVHHKAQGTRNSPKSIKNNAINPSKPLCATLA